MLGRYSPTELDSERDVIEKEYVTGSFAFFVGWVRLAASPRPALTIGGLALLADGEALTSRWPLQRCGSSWCAT